MTEPARRAQILDAAGRLLRHYGSQKTTIADVAREAGVGVGTVYLEFSSKEEIVSELSKARFRHLLERMRAAAGATHQSYADRLKGVIEARVVSFLALSEEGAHACDLIHCMHPAVKTAEKTFEAEQLQLVIDLLTEATQAGEFEVAKPQLVARTVLRAYASFTPPWLFRGPQQETVAMLASMHDLLLSGLLRRGPRRRGRGVD